MASTLRQLVDQTRIDHLLAGSREIVARLNGAITTTTQTAITLTGVSPVAGMVLTVDSEDIYVIAATGAATTDVVRGWNGTTSATHLTLTLAYVNQKFPDAKIIRAINDELVSLTSPTNGLYRVKTVTLTTASGKLGYDLTAVASDLIDVLYPYVRDAAGTITYRFARNREWELRRNMPTADFASGYALTFRRSITAARTLLVVYAAKYSRVTTADLATDIGTTTGIQDTAEDLLPLGAAIRLMAGREPKRSFTESRPESRPAADVPPGAVNGSVNGLRLLRYQRIGEERARLQAQYEQFQNQPVAATY